MKTKKQSIRARARRFCGFLLLTLASVLVGTNAWATTYILGATNLTVGPSAGMNSVVLGVTPLTNTWIAVPNSAWLHISSSSQSGTGSANVVFSYDANVGPTRSGSLTIAGSVVIITQAGSTYVAAGLATLVSSGLSSVSALAVDALGNVYIADAGFNNTVDKWSVSNSSLTVLVSSGLRVPNGVAVDASGNVYIADTSNDTIKKWSVVNHDVTTLISSGLGGPTLLALDATGNLFINDPSAGTVYKWSLSQGTLSNLGASVLSDPTGLAVDAAGNAYVSDWNYVEIYEWTAATEIMSGLFGWNSRPGGIAVDGGGNIYVAGGYPTVSEWMAANGSSSVLVPSGLSAPSNVAVDGQGNLYIADQAAIKELPAAFVDTSAKSEDWNPGSDTLPVVVPASANLSGPLAPTGDQTWLTITGTTNGIVSFSFASNIFLARTAHITLLGRSISITQSGVSTYSLGVSNLEEAAMAGSDSVALTVTPNIGGWVATANDSWLHLSAANQGGVGSTNLMFSFDANPGAVRIGTLTIGGQILKVIQLGPIALGTTALLEGPTSGSDSVILGGIVSASNWTASTHVAWLHLSPANQSGTGNAYVVFSYDANPGPTRSGSITIASQTLTVTQAGSTFVPAQQITTLPSMGPGPDSVAVDSAGNLYAGESYFGDVYPDDLPYVAASERNASNGSIATLFSAEGFGAQGVAVDGSGNVYFSSGGFYDNNGLYEWTRSNDAISTLVSGYANGIAVDSAGDVYIADEGDNLVEEWYAPTKRLLTLVSNGMSSPAGVALDVADNVYIANTGSNTILELQPGYTNVSALVSSGLSGPQGIAVDGSGNVFIADTGNNAVKEWLRASNVVIMLVSNLNRPVGVTVDAEGDVYIDEFTSYLGPYSTGPGNGDVRELVRTFVDTSTKIEAITAGSDTFTFLPTNVNLLPAFAPVTHESWLSITGVSNGVVSFAFSASSSNRTGYIAFLGQNIVVVQGGESFIYSLGTTNLLEGPAAGTDSVVLGVNPYFGSWAATANADWLHLNLSSTGCTNVIFNFDANPGPTRSGALTIAGQTVTVTQAGSSYVPAGVMTTLASNGLSYPSGVAVDSTGNVYWADYGDSAIYEWSATNDTVTKLVSSGLVNPQDVAVDSDANVYIVDTGDNALKKWTAAGDNLVTLISSGLSEPKGVAVDSVGDVYVANTGDGPIEELIQGDTNLTVLGAGGLNTPDALAVDVAGNIYIVDYGNSALKKYTPTNGNVIPLITNLSYPSSVAVDGSGNSYVMDYIGSQQITEWVAANGTAVTLITNGLTDPAGVAVDGAGNIYIGDQGDNAIKELPRAFVDRTPKSEGSLAGSDALLPVLPTTENLLPPFAPTSDQPWLTITGVTNGVVGYSFTATTSNRTVNITVLGQVIAVTQDTATYSFATNFLMEGPAAGSDSVFLTVTPETTTWAATVNVPWLHLNQNGTGSTNLIFTYDANPGPIRTGVINVAGQSVTVVQAPSSVTLGVNALWEGPQSGSDSVVLATASTGAQWAAVPSASWLHLSPANQSGSGSTNVIFSFDANPGSTRTGSISFNAQTLTVTQAGSTYVQAGIVTALVSSGLNAPGAVAVGSPARVHIADTFNNAIKLWTAANDSVTTLVASGLSSPSGVAVDGAGNVYIADTGNNAIKEWKVANSNMITLVPSGLNAPQGIAVDSSGNVYFADTGNNAIKEWKAANSNVITLISSGLSFPIGVAVDAAENIYIADAGHDTIKEWVAASNNLTALPFSGLNTPEGVAVDGSGNVYVADTGNSVIKKWTPASNSMTVLVSSGLAFSYGMSVDATGNVYIADTDNQAIKELPRAFVDPTPKFEGLVLGTDVLPAVLPATTDLLAPFAPTSNEPWLTIGGINNGVVSFLFTANAGPARTANLTLLGQIIPVTQGSIGAPPILTGVQWLTNGVLQFNFTNAESATFTVLASTNLSLPLSRWTVVGTASNIAPGQFQFTSQGLTNESQVFYSVRSP